MVLKTIQRSENGKTKDRGGKTHDIWETVSQPLGQKYRT